MAHLSDSFNFSETDRLAANTIRVLSAEMVQRANSGHPGMPMGFALPAHVLWSRFLRFDPDRPFWPGRDRFILSAGHGSALLYSLLHLSGYDLTMDDLKQFRQWESRTPGHPEYGVTPGVETTTGPLGQGFGNAVGMAVAQRYVREQLGLHRTEGFDPLDHFIYAVCGDGDMQEGISSEAASFAGRQSLGRLIVLYDDNRISIDGSTDLAWREDVPARFRAYGWHTGVADGGDPETIARAIAAAKEVTDRPSLIAVKTHIGYGSPGRQDSPAAHGSPLGEEELQATRRALGWDYPSFTVPEEVYSLYAETADRGRSLHDSWKAKLNEWLAADEDRASLWRVLVDGDDPPGLFDTKPDFTPGESVALRSASGKALNAAARANPALFGGCADLSGSVKSEIEGGGVFLPETPGGRNIRFGIREHAMGSIANGMALYGLRPFTGTFLVFSDYMRPPLRLAAMMGLPVIFLFSHDSIGVGEDGPTHQPVEHLAALRAIPGLDVFRPGDPAEMVEAWASALRRKDGPTVIISSRQGVPVIDRKEFAAADGTGRGGYVLADCAGDPELILIGTGSELSLALDAWRKLHGEGVRVRVVSLPCMELFDRQDPEYRESVLPGSVRNVIAVEAGISQGWRRFVGDEGVVVSLEHFGASAPGKTLFAKFGFSVARIIKIAKTVLEHD